MKDEFDALGLNCAKHAYLRSVFIDNLGFKPTAIYFQIILTIFLVFIKLSCNIVAKLI